jgi:hypothetical protein
MQIDRRRQPITTQTNRQHFGLIVVSNDRERLAHNQRIDSLELLAGRIAPNGPLQVHESPLALQTVPVKRHKKRRNQREAYHRRVQKKWTKRHGTKQVPAAYMIDNSVIGGYGQTLVAHPSIVARLKTPNVLVTGDQRP